MAHSGRRKAEQCISDGYLVPIVAVDSKYHLFLLLAQPPPAGGQQHQLASQQEELHHQRQVTTENLQRMAEMEQKEARLKETFFRRLNQRIVQEIEKGSNILLSDDDWEDIVQNADIIFDNFTRRLQQHYPALNKEDLRYCCMVKMQLSQLEMSQIMHLEKDSVKKRLKRIRMEKMKADSGVTLEELLRRF